jgi:hypothetical protein
MMDFISGALPNVMFIAGIIAIGIALGIEFKIVEIKGQLSKHGRIGTFLVGMVLIGFSIYLYTKPNQLAAAPAVAGSPPSPVPTTQATMAVAVPTEVKPSPIPPAVIAQLPSPIPPTVIAQPTTAAEAVTVEGTIRQMGVQKHQTIVVVNNVAYTLSSEVVTQLGPSLQVGATLRLTGTRLSDGTILVSSVTVSGTPSTEHDDEKGKDKED